MALPGTASNRIHEPVWVLIGADEDNLTNLGYCNTGDVTVDIGQNWVVSTSAQTGEMPLDFYDNGQTIEVTCEFQEVINWDLWAEAFLMGSTQTNTETPQDTRFTSHDEDVTGALVGQSGLALAQMLVLRPVALYTDTSTQTERDFVVVQALCTNVGSIPFGVATPQVLPLTFSGIADMSATDGAVLWYRGKTDGTWSD
jgi:hypothetical protein